METDTNSRIHTRISKLPLPTYRKAILSIKEVAQTYKVAIILKVKDQAKAMSLTQ